MRNKMLLAAVLSLSVSHVAWAESSGVPAWAVKEYQPAAGTQGMAPAMAAPFDSTGEGAIPALPLSVMAAGDVRYINGGISDEELSQLKAVGHEYNVHLTLTTSSGEFLSGVKIAVANASGTPILAVDDSGPYLYIALKPGTYTLNATYNGATQKLPLKIGKGTLTPQLRFAE